MTAECKSDLLLRARSGNASDAELIALDAHLLTCSSCRLTREVSRDFDAIGGAEPGDGARIARMAAASRRVMRSSRQPPSSPPSWVRIRPVWPLAVAAILIGGLATAAGIWRTTSADAPLAAQAPEEGDQRDRAAPLRPPRAAPPPAPVAELPGTDPADPVARPEPATSGVKARGASRAGALYKSANEARRAGDRARAVRLYRELQRDYPGSPEAKLSRVSLGGLLLDDGAAAQAAEQFDAYASGPGNQRLGAEALYGKGKALMSLGRRVEEIRTWQRLLREYPDSPYTTHARRRLAELR